jgi:uncharacterized protein
MVIMLNYVYQESYAAEKMFDSTLFPVIPHAIQHILLTLTQRKTMLKKIVYVVVTVILTPVLLSAQENRPSFDCSKAKSDAEKLVCSDSQLALLDRELSRVYTLALQEPSLDAKGKKYLQAFQRGWVKGRDEVWKVEDKKRYVRDSYLFRIAEILREHPATRGNEQDGISSTPVTYDCEGTSAEACFIQSDPASAVFSIKGSSFVLINDVSGSGAKYIGKYPDGMVELWTKGNEAKFIAIDGQKLQCTDSQ